MSLIVCSGVFFFQAGDGISALLRSRGLGDVYERQVPTLASVKPYTPLEVLGRDLYIREGCVGCHSQMVRPFRSETERYGEYSKAGEYVYDQPFRWC
mgnify:CR=1 FL=1